MSQAYPPQLPQQHLPNTFRCRNHPDREGVGICVSCRTVVCVECSTKVDRMNYCIRCLRAAEPAQESEESNPRRDTLVGIPLLLGAFCLSVLTFAFLGWVLSLLRLWSGGGVTQG